MFKLLEECSLLNKYIKINLTSTLSAKFKNLYFYQKLYMPRNNFLTWERRLSIYLIVNWQKIRNQQIKGNK